MIPATSPVRSYTFPRAGEPVPWLGAGPAAARSQCGAAGTPSDPPHAVDVVADQAGLRLPARPGGPLALDAPDGSLGRLTLPRGFALDARRRCYFVDRRGGLLWRFDPGLLPQSSDQPCHPLLDLGTEASGGRTTRAPWPPWSIAATSRTLFVVNPYCRSVTGYDLRHGSIRDVYCFSGEEPRDVAVHNESVYVLTDRAVHVRRTPSGSWQRLTGDFQGRDYIRLIVAREGTAFLYAADQGLTGLDGTPDPAAVRTRFSVPPVYTWPTPDAGGLVHYVIPPELTSPCGLGPPLPAADGPPELGHAAVTREMLERDDLTHGFVIREDGTRLRTQDFPFPRQPLFLTGGEPRSAAVHSVAARGTPAGAGGNAAGARAFWISEAIDSTLYCCRWDRVEIELAQLPPGTRVVVSTYTYDPPDRDAVAAEKSPPEGIWAHAATLAGPATPVGSPPGVTEDCLVRSRPGRYLRLRLQLFGDGYTTPVVRRVTARGPRQSHVDFLPAVMREDERSRDFLERLLAVFQTEWDALETRIDGLSRLFDPAAVPDAQLEQLAVWLGLALPESWSAEQRRNFLKAAPRMLMAPATDERDAAGTVRRRDGGTRRGTARQLREYLAAFLSGLTGLGASDLRGFPWIIEGFRERQHQILGAKPVLAGEDVPGASQTAVGRGDPLTIPPAHTLWGPESVGRFQLGDRSVLGRHKLLPPAGAELDVFHTHAHRFRVVLPACWVAAPGALRSLRETIEQEKPAHTTYALTLVRPGMRIGLQSTVGLDTILGDWPQTVRLRQREPTIGLGQGVALPESPAQRPPPLAVDGPLEVHEL